MKTLFLLIASILICNLEAVAQAPTYSWAKGSINGSGVVYDAVTTDNVNHFIYAAGSFGSGAINLGTGNLMNANPGSGTNDIFVAKYDESGNLIWAKTFGGLDDDNASGVAVDNNGNLFVSGFYSSPTLSLGSTTLTDTSAGSVYYSFLAKLDASGNVIWAQAGLSGMNLQAFAVTTDHFGNAYTTGMFLVHATFGTHQISSPLGGMFVAKYDASGNVSWVNNSMVTGSGNGGLAIGNAISLDGSGNCIVAGSYTDTCVFGATVVPQSNTAYYDRFVCKLDPQGNFVWAKGSGVWQGPDENQGVGCDADGNILLSGYVSLPTVSPNNSAYCNAFFTEKLDASGNQVWMHAGDSSATGLFHRLVCNPDGSFYAALSISDTARFGTHVINPVFPFGIGLYVVVIKYDGSGNVLWVKAITPATLLPTSANLEALAMDDLGNLFVSGGLKDTCYFDSHALFGDFTNNDFYLAKLGNNLPNDAATVTAADGIVIYPNPSTGSFHFFLPSSCSQATLYFYDLQGRCLQSVPAGNRSELSWDGDQLPAGTYFCRIVDAGKGVDVIRKLVIQE